MFKYHGVLILGILMGFFLGNLIRSSTGISFFGAIGIIVGTITTEKIMNNYLIKSNKSPQSNLIDY